MFGNVVSLVAANGIFEIHLLYWLDLPFESFRTELVSSLSRPYPSD